MENLINNQISELDSYISTKMKTSKIPGLSIIIVNKKESYIKSYGYCSNTTTPVTPSTYFELGSLTKAFTALAIILLKQDKKLSLDTPITKFIPWLKIYAPDKTTCITDNILIKHLLYQTSGLPFSTLKSIYPGTDTDALKNTVHKLNGTICDFEPGSKFQYATINYDILGYIIELVTGKSYEAFVKEKILSPLDLSSTYLSRTDAKSSGILSNGFKLAFGKPIYYNAPEYRGNLPAGYILSNAIDMDKWMSIQLDKSTIPDELKEAITFSHQFDDSVEMNGRFYYGGGWSVHMHGDILKHGGKNPNYSSMIILDKKNTLGICVLTNINSSATQSIAENALRILKGKKVKSYTKDTNYSIDRIFSYVSISLFICNILLLCTLITSFFTQTCYKTLSFFLIPIFIILLLSVTLVHLKIRNKYYHKMPFRIVSVWAPHTVKLSYYLMSFFFIQSILFIIRTLL